MTRRASTCAWALIAAVLAWGIAASALALPAAANNAIFVRFTFHDALTGAHVIVCEAREGVRYGWDAATGFTLIAPCFPIGEAIFKNGFDPLGAGP